MFFRDIQHVYTVLLTLWTYLTPLFYSIKALNKPIVEKLMKFNPMYHYVTYFRDLLMGTVPSVWTHVVCYGFALGMFAVGILVMTLVRNKIAAKL